MSGFTPDQDGAEVHVSPNFGPRRGGKRPNMIVLHYTGMPTGTEAEAWLCNPASEVSAHYVVHEDGGLVQSVREEDRAWHAGKSSWQGEADINSLSIGIEIVNPGHGLGYPDFLDEQIGTVIALCRGIQLRHRVPPERILAHSDVAPGRKIDPGEKFPWAVLAAAGIGHYVEPRPVFAGESLTPGSQGDKVEALQSMLALYGYGVDITGLYDETTQVAVEAFQRHFRPKRVDGIADPSTVATLIDLLGSLPLV